MVQQTIEKKISYPLKIDGKIVGVIWRDTLVGFLAGEKDAVPVQYKTKDMEKSKTVGWINKWSEKFAPEKK